MDNELKLRTESAKSAKATADNQWGQSVDEGVSVSEDASILSNLLQSLDASGGGSGPVVNILREMEGP